MGAVTVTDVDTTSRLLGQIGIKLQDIVDALFTPDKRAEWWAKIKQVALANPKITVRNSTATL